MMMDLQEAKDALESLRTVYLHELAAWRDARRATTHAIVAENEAYLRADTACALVLRQMAMMRDILERAEPETKQGAN